MVGLQQVAQLVDQHVLERRRPRQRQRQVQRHRTVRRQRAPLRGHHLQPHPRGRAWQPRQVSGQPAADIGAHPRLVELAQHAPQRSVAGPRRQLDAGASGIHLDPGETAFLPAHRQQRPAQRQHAGFAQCQRRCQQALAIEPRQPLPVGLQEALAGRQAGAQRQGQPRAAFIDAELEPPRTRVAHAQHVDLGIVQAQPHGVALDDGRGDGGQAAEQGGHRSSIVPGRPPGRSADRPFSCRPCSA